MADTEEAVLALAPSEEAEAKEKRKNMELVLKETNNPWGLTPKAIEAKRAVMTMLATKNGLQARVPLVCKGEGCPYSSSCQLLINDLAPRGEYCPVELAQIDIRSAGYSSDLDMDTASFTDQNLMSELITLDIMIERCKGLLAEEGTPVIDMAIGVDKEGNEVRQPAVSKAWEAYERISKKRDSVYNLLMLTRKDKKTKDEDSDGMSTSQILHDVINSDIYTE